MGTQLVCSGELWLCSGPGAALAHIRLPSRAATQLPSPQHQPEVGSDFLPLISLMTGRQSFCWGPLLLGSPFSKFKSAWACKDECGFWAPFHQLPCLLRALRELGAGAASASQSAAPQMLKTHEYQPLSHSFEQKSDHLMSISYYSLSNSTLPLWYLPNS